MSNRTSEANKAIALAWAKEQQLIRKGKGTRDWTPEQQQSILDRGKAYSDDGRAFEGHHMKSAEKYPEYQGDSENIQFLSRPEHFSAHDGNFQNSTNGYFDPCTCTTRDFGLNKYEPCAVIELKESIISPTGVQAQNANRNISTPAGASDILIPPSTITSKKSGFGGTVKHIAGKVVKFCVKHKEVIAPIAAIVASTVAIAIKETIDRGSKSSNGNYDDDYDYPTYPSPQNTSEENSAASTQREAIIERSSPIEHTVPAHSQRYGKDKTWKEKESYTRGKNSVE